ncbi:hypothetical protein YB2330_006180 [Saitoella coloradoensis]
MNTPPSTPKKKKAAPEYLPSHTSVASSASSGDASSPSLKRKLDDDVDANITENFEARKIGESETLKVPGQDLHPLQVLLKDRKALLGHVRTIYSGGLSNEAVVSGVREIVLGLRSVIGTPTPAASAHLDRYLKRCLTHGGHNTPDPVLPDCLNEEREQKVG